MGELAKVGELDHLALGGGQFSDGLANGGAGFAGGNLDIGEAGVRKVEGRLLDDPMERPAALAQRVDGPVANGGQNPAAEVAERGVERRAASPDGQKRCLDGVLRGVGAADPARDTKGDRLVAAMELLESTRFAILNRRPQALVAEPRLAVPGSGRCLHGLDHLILSNLCRRFVEISMKILRGVPGYFPRYAGRLSKIRAMDEEEIPRFRIGELSRRVEVATTVLRAWEKRYGLLQPARSEGNFRLYSLDDVARVWAMKAHLARGSAAAEAARLALAEDVGRPEGPAQGALDSGQAADELRAALVRFDEAGANRVLDRAFALNPLEQVLSEIVLPTLRRIGDGWERGEIGVAQEHFASTVIRSRLLALAQGWNSGSGPAAALACPPGELHDIGLICFGLALWRRGWRIFYIGQDTPIEQLRRMASSVSLSLLVVAAHSPDLFREPAQELRALAAEAHLAIAGAGASPEIAAELRATALGEDAIAAAAAIAAG